MLSVFSQLWWGHHVWQHSHSFEKQEKFPQCGESNSFLYAKKRTCQLIRKLLLFIFTCRKLRIRPDFSSVMREQNTGQAVKFNHGCFKSNRHNHHQGLMLLILREQTPCKNTLGCTGHVNPCHCWHSRRFHTWWARHSLCCQEAPGESKIKADTNLKSQLVIPYIYYS